MSLAFPSEAWTEAYRDAVNANEGYQKHGKPWTFGAVAFVVRANPEIGLAEDVGMIMDVHEGQCRGVTYLTGAQTETDAAAGAPFVVVGEYARWQDCLEGRLDPIKSMMEGKLKLTRGHLPTMLRFVESSRQLVVSAQAVDTEFLG